MIVFGQFGHPDHLLQYYCNVAQIEAETPPDRGVTTITPLTGLILVSVHVYRYGHSGLRYDIPTYTLVDEQYVRDSTMVLGDHNTEL